MKRKSLLVAMAAMSLAAIGAGSVSTLAWYQAMATASVSDTAKPQTATAATAVEQLDDLAFALDVQVTVDSGSAGETRSTVGGTMEMTHYTTTAPTPLVGDDDSDHFYFGYYATNVTSSIRYLPGQISAAADKIDFWQIIKVTVALDATDLSNKGYSETEALALLAAQNSASTVKNGFQISVGRTADANSRALFLELDQSTKAIKNNATPQESLTFTAEKVLASASKASHYFLMYINGENSSIDLTTAAPNGNYTVSVAGAHVTY